jgi:hypothetical protein
LKIIDASTVYKIDTINVDGKPEVQFKCLKIMVGREDLNLRPLGPEPDSGSWRTVLNLAGRKCWYWNELPLALDAY